MTEAHQSLLRTKPGWKVRSLSWDGDALVDWAGGGIRYGLDGSVSDPHVRYPYRFDAVQTSPSGGYAVIYERLGTKGLVLQDGRMLRELNRSYYHAGAYEYPVTLFALPDGREALAHCPDDYNRLELEVLATGERLTSRPASRAADFFHSRLTVDPSGAWLLSRGWIWHPFDTVSFYSIPAALTDPSTLDCLSEFPRRNVEITTAAFSSDSRLVVTSRANAEDFRDEDEKRGELRPGFLGIYDLQLARYLAPAPLEEEAGTLMPVGQEHVMGFYQHPKLIHIRTGRVLHRWRHLSTGKQLSSISRSAESLPPLALDPERRRFAVASGEEITVVTLPGDFPPVGG